MVCMHQHWFACISNGLHAVVIICEALAPTFCMPQLQWFTCFGNGLHASILAVFMQTIADACKAIANAYKPLPMYATHGNAYEPWMMQANHCWCTQTFWCRWFANQHSMSTNGSLQTFVFVAGTTLYALPRSNKFELFEQNLNYSNKSQIQPNDCLFDSIQFVWNTSQNWLCIWYQI